MKVFDLPKAITEKIIRAIHKRGGVPKLFQIESKQLATSKTFNPREDQLLALQSWLKTSSGIFEMATGTGKTFAGLMCLNSILEKNKTSSMRNISTWRCFSESMAR